MKTEFAAAITQLSAERNLPKEVVLAALESALTSAYKRELPTTKQDILVKLDSATGKVKVYIQKVVVESVADPNQEISMDQARNLQDTAQVGDIVEIESLPKNTGRITAQSAKQIILQRLREAEYHTTYGEFAGREGELVTGVVQFTEPKQIYIRLDRTEAILPLREQVQNEHYFKGQRLKLYPLEVVRGVKRPQMMVSRSHPNLLRRLFELEIPEVHSGVVQLKAIAREAGYRTKVAVSTTQEGVDPIGCCLGPRSIRLQSIIGELNGEKIDVIQWHSNPEAFISNALSPAQVTSIKTDETAKTATVVVPDKQLSLAIGKEGQNARLAARLTGWRIDIKSVSAAEAEKAATQGVTVTEELISTEPVALEPISDAVMEEPTEPLAVSEASPQPLEEKLQLRFAEDILPKLQKVKRHDAEENKKPAKGKSKSKRYKKLVLHSEDDEDEE
ncbi:MAG: transcription termination/antitermination protein NusA [Dehalococcoidia bacterium]|nr:transcription termination/antitermination protein NusA [Dehalococcoidia bacterium]